MKRRNFLTIAAAGLGAPLTACKKAPTVSADGKPIIRIGHFPNITHVQALLDLLTKHFKAFFDPDVVEAAIWFHDAVYDTHAKDNEFRSAELARERLLPAVHGGKLSSRRLYLIGEMIEATATHVVPQLECPEAVADAEKFLDMDLSILGASEPEFDRYEADVRKEYSWADDGEWRKGRTGILQSFLRRDVIFHSELFRSLLEASARENILRSLQRLRDPPPVRQAGTQVTSPSDKFSPTSST